MVYGIGGNCGILGNMKCVSYRDCGGRRVRPPLQSISLRFTWIATRLFRVPVASSLS
jgi:hypothetical protein